MATVIRMSMVDYIEIERDLMQFETDGAGQIDVEYEIISEPPDFEDELTEVLEEVEK